MPAELADERVGDEVHSNFNAMASSSGGAGARPGYSQQAQGPRSARPGQPALVPPPRGNPALMRQPFLQPSGMVATEAGRKDTFDRSNIPLAIVKDALRQSNPRVAEEFSEAALRALAVTAKETLRDIVQEALRQEEELSEEHARHSSAEGNGAGAAESGAGEPSRVEHKEGMRVLARGAALEADALRDAREQLESDGRLVHGRPPSYDSGMTGLL